MMKSVPLLLGDQLESSIRISTQTIGNYFGYRGKHLSIEHFGQKDLVEICLLSAPFLYYLRKSGVLPSESVTKEINSKINSLKLSAGGYVSSGSTWKPGEASTFDTAMALLPLLKLHETSYVDNRSSISECLSVLRQKLAECSIRPNTLPFTELFACYSLLQATAYFKLSSPLDGIQQVLRLVTQLKPNCLVSQEGKHLPQHLLKPFAGRLLIELGIAGKNHQMCSLAHSWCFDYSKRVEKIVEYTFGRGARDKKILSICIAEASLWSYNMLQLHEHFNIPHFEELSGSLLRLISEIVINETRPNDLYFPEGYHLEKKELISYGTSVYPLRFFLDASEKAKIHFAQSVQAPTAITHRNERVKVHRV